MGFIFLIGIFVAIAIVFIGTKATGQQNISNTAYGKAFLIIFLISFFGLLVSPSDAFNIDLAALINNFDSSESDSVADGFTIEGYEVILDVGIDNKVEVTENIDVNFYESGHHGIYRFIPSWLEYTDKNNKTIKRKSVISNLYAEGDSYVTNTVSKGKEKIRIGDADYTISGDHKYVIKYNYDMGKDPFNGFDEFIFHAFGDFWGTRIKNPKIVIHMPKGLDSYDINFYMDKYRKDNINGLINYNVAGNTVTIEGKENLYLMKSLTVDIALPENYFVGGSFNYGFGSFVLSMIVLAITGYIIYMWSKYGKNYDKNVQTVEFYSPDNLNSAEIGYIYNNRKSTKKLTLSLIIQLASKGYIKIDEIKEGNKNSEIQITNLCIKPKKVNNIEDIKLEERNITLKKTKEIDDSLTDNEKNMMAYIFKDNNFGSLNGNFDWFNEVKDKLINNGYIEIIKDNLDEITKANEEIQKKYSKRLDKYRINMEEYKRKLNEYEKKMNSLPEIKGMEKAVYNKLFESNDIIILSKHKTFYQEFNEVNNDLRLRFNEKIYDKEAYNKKNISRILNFVVLVLGIYSFFFIEDMDPKLSILYYVSFGCVLVNLFFTIIMGRKTDYGEMISARIKGFRDFLITVEKEKLESLVLQNPHYFYDILPYTYVLNISKKWVEKFENIQMPEVDMGNFDYSSGDSILNDIGSSIYYPISSSSSSSSSSGCSSCGGGCSSCGGGCSSCGGGGSW